MTDRSPDPPPEADVVLVVRRTIGAPVERVFDAWTKPEHLRQWWGPMGVSCPTAEIDLRVGGSYRIANQFADGQVSWIVGRFELVERPEKLVYTWRLEPGPSTSDPSSERVTVRFERREGGTEVIVVHERIAGPASRKMHEEGWNGCLDGLARYVGGTTESTTEA